MHSAKEVESGYIALWNESDQAKRRATLAKTWAEGAIYVDPMVRGEGHEEIDALVGAVQAKFPGFVFSLIGPADGHGKVARFSWGLGPRGGDAIIKGTDFLTLEDGRIASVTGFLDLVRASA